MPPPPLVSVGLPVYNGARYLRAALDDFLGQTFGDFELIISDNHSDDETEAIGWEYAARDARVRYVRNDRNLGALPNANQTIALARGEYFALAAYDDRHAPDFLGRLVEALEADPGAVLAYGACARIGEHGEPFAYDRDRGGWVHPGGAFYAGDRALETRLPDDPLVRFRAVLGSTSVDAPIHGLFRLGALRRTGGHVLYGSDRLVVAHAALLGRFAYVHAPLFGFRIHGASTLHLDHATRVEREAPGVDAARIGLKTLANYARAVAETDLSTPAKLAAWAATARYAVCRAARNTLKPGRTNYFGWGRQEAGFRPQPVL